MIRLLIFVAVIVGVAMWLLKGRRKGSASDDGAAARNGQSGPQKGEKDGSTEMLACAHCGVHLPRPDASFDVQGRAYCSEAHRLAGPR
jgi:uncharacterized protein